MTAYQLDAGRLADLNHRLYGLRVGDFKYTAERLDLGELTGNRFTVRAPAPAAPCHVHDAQRWSVSA